MPPDAFVPLTDLASPGGGWHVRRREGIAAEPERVFRALTQPEELAAWWCDHAAIDPRPGGRFRFGGPRSLPPSLAAGSGPWEHSAEVVELSPPHRLVYRWPLGDVETTVTFELSEQLAATDVVVTQTAERAPFSDWLAGRDAAGWWSLFLPALRDFVEQGSAPLRVDFAALDDASSMGFETGFNTFHWVVWSKLVLAEELGRWWGRSPSIVLEPGGDFRLRLEGFGPSRVIACDDARRLVHDWNWREGEPASTIEWRIDESEEHTRVSVADSGPFPVAMTSIAVYWASTLLDLKRMSERGISPRDVQRA